MILAIDMGNTNTVIGGIDEKKTYFIEPVSYTHLGDLLCEAVINALKAFSAPNGPVHGTGAYAKHILNLVQKLIWVPGFTVKLRMCLAYAPVP